MKRFFAVFTLLFLLCIGLPALFLADQAFAASSVILEWDANSEPDLAGYKVYYKTGSSGGEPYNGTGATEGDSPIDVGNVTRYSLTGLTDGATYFFVVTAYDTGGFESGYSNEVSTEPPTAPVNLRVRIGISVDVSLK